MRRNLLLSTTLLAATGLTAGAVYTRSSTDALQIVTQAVTRGAVVNVVSATGTLEAVTTVQVGSQVSGSVESLHADFNSIVKKGQLLARLDQSLYRAAIEQAAANLARATADEDRLAVSLADANAKLARAHELSARQLIPASELDAAGVTRDVAAAQVRSAAASVTQARASLRQTEVSLAKTVITSPIDGIVISRNVDVGQTVAASLSAPTLFVIAADLTAMQLNASIDESDLGAIAEGQPVTFEVDAWPGERFDGVVRQVRLNPTVTSNVVTYAAIVEAPNAELKLKPGMTATLNVEIARRDDVLRVPASALRFKPTAEQREALGLQPAAAAAGTATLWLEAGESIAAVGVRTGITDGTWIEVVGASVTEGQRLVTQVMTGDAAASSASASRSGSTSPLMNMGAPPQGRR